MDSRAATIVTICSRTGIANRAATAAKSIGMVRAPPTGGAGRRAAFPRRGRVGLDRQGPPQGLGPDPSFGSRCGGRRLGSCADPSGMRIWMRKRPNLGAEVRAPRESPPGRAPRGQCRLSCQAGVDHPSTTECSDMMPTAGGSDPEPLRPVGHSFRALSTGAPPGSSTGHCSAWRLPGGDSRGARTSPRGGPLAHPYRMPEGSAHEPSPPAPTAPTPEARICWPSPCGGP